MDSDAGPAHVYFKARLRADLHNRFINHFPQQGSNVWWLNTMMERFLDEVEKSPDFEAQMTAAMEQAREAA
jgi:hypothetical protein